MAGSSDYSYDDNGNMTGKEQAATFWGCYYDYENRLTKAKQGYDSTLFYYNGDGQRQKKVCTADTSTQYISDGMYSVVERTNTGRLRYKYIYANGLLMARIDSSGTVYQYQHNGLGSVIGVNDQNSYLCESYLYDEFGDSLGTWKSPYYIVNNNSYKYTGQEWDGAPLFGYNLRARQYYPKLGRFGQNDPIGDAGGSLNWYLYVANNPVNDVDPSGMLSVKDMCLCAYYAIKCVTEGAKCKEALQKKIDGMSAEQLSMFLTRLNVNSVSQLFTKYCFANIPSCINMMKYCSQIPTPPIPGSIPWQDIIKIPK